MTLPLLLKRNVATGTAPINLAPPVLSGTWVEGNTVSTSNGNWTGTPTSYSYQWQKGSSAGTGFTNIAGATTSSLLLTNTAVGFTFRAIVTATNAQGSNQAVSAVSPVVAAASAPVTPEVPSHIPWRYVLADSAGVSLGELVASARQLTVGVSQTATATCTIQNSDLLRESVVPLASYLKVYNSVGALVFYGPVISDEETGSSGQPNTVRVIAADLSWKLSKRLTGTPGVTLSFTNVDSGTIAYTLLGDTNSQAPTGLIPGLAETFVPRTIEFDWSTKTLEGINTLGAIAGSYEWAVRYSDPGTGATPTARLDLEVQLGGDVSTAVELSYGVGESNCSNYTRMRSADQMANRVFVSGEPCTAFAADGASQTTYGRYDDVLSFGDIAIPSLLTDLAAAHVSARANPKVVVGLTVVPNLAPRFAVDWQVGDIVTARVLSGGSSRVNGRARLWGATVTIDDLGNEAPEMVLTPNE